MRNLSQIIAIVFLVQSFLFAQKSPHGKNFNIKCSVCHTTNSWKVNVNNIKFDHSTTGFKLIGQHKDLGCVACHTTLKFKNTSGECISCHTDIHQNSVGSDCSDCHNSNTWLVPNVLEIHEKGRFPLIGVHQTLDCGECHKSASLLNFKPIGATCYQCHREQYLSATPNHLQLGYSTTCEQCHSMTATTWGLEGFVHAFFPLTDSHAISDCSVCHKGNTFAGLSSDCYSCHQDKYESTNNPNHLAVQFSTDCSECHEPTLWTNGAYKAHDGLYSPTIYSGEHEGEWNSCNDCHINPSDYQVYSCLKCHDSNSGGGDLKIKGNLKLN